jgi:hypothetical protein
MMHRKAAAADPRAYLSTSVKLELFRTVLETSGHALAWLLTKARGRPAVWVGWPDTDALQHHLSEEFMWLCTVVYTNEHRLALSRPRARTAPQAKPPNTTTRCGCSLGPTPEQSRPKRRRRSVARRCILEYGNMMRRLVDITKYRQVWEQQRKREGECERDIERELAAHKHCIGKASTHTQHSTPSSEEGRFRGLPRLRHNTERPRAKKKPSEA